MSEGEKPKRQLSEAQKAALRKGNPKAFTKTPASGGAGAKPSKSKPKAAAVRAGAPPAKPKARRAAAGKPPAREPEQRGSGGGFLRGLLDW